MDIHSDKLGDSDNSFGASDAKDYSPSASFAQPQRAAQVEPPPKTRYQRPEPNNGDGLAGGIFWLMATAMLVLGAWFVGPLAVEKYQYAATKGRVTAEYENAQTVLDKLPLNDVSQAFQLVAQRIRPSVVSIRAEGEKTSRGMT